MSIIRRCVRCGVGPRYVDLDGNETYLCAECIIDPATRQQAELAREADPDRPRLWLKQSQGWYGGWGRAS